MTSILNRNNDLQVYHLVSAATTNATVVKPSSGRLYGYYIYNSNLLARKLVFHDAELTPTAGENIKFSLVIPASNGANLFSTEGIPFVYGISITTVTEIADNGTTAIGLDDLNINLFYR